MIAEWLPVSPEVPLLRKGDSCDGLLLAEVQALHGSHGTIACYLLMGIVDATEHKPSLLRLDAVRYWLLPTLAVDGALSRRLPHFALAANGSSRVTQAARIRVDTDGSVSWQPATAEHLAMLSLLRPYAPLAPRTPHRKVNDNDADGAAREERSAGESAGEDS